MSLFERIGGEQAVELAVIRLYENIMNDDRINHFFKHLDIENLIGHQKRFLTFAFGGNSNYVGLTMRNAHKRLVEEYGVNDSHFDAVLDNLRMTLVELSLQEELIQEVLYIAESTRDDVLNKDTKG